jgi:hypothetical protein
MEIYPEAASLYRFISVGQRPGLGYGVGPYLHVFAGDNIRRILTPFPVVKAIGVSPAENAQIRTFPE